jgi:crotonobetainyl-CoA:carnitine CoA-transferase CaiB-like acyl-CoA transferase
LLQSLIAMEDFQAARWLIDHEIPEQAGNDHPTIAAMGLFEASDAPINIAPAGAGQFESLCDVIGGTSLLDDPRFAVAASRSQNRDDLNAEIAAGIRARPAAYWIERLNEVGVPCGPVNRMDQVFDDPQVKSVGITRPVRHPRLGELEVVGQPIDVAGSAPVIGTAAPDRGAHNAEVLGELGFGAEDIAALRQSGAI